MNKELGLTLEDMIQLPERPLRCCGTHAVVLPGAQEGTSIARCSSCRSAYDLGHRRLIRPSQLRFLDPTDAYLAPWYVTTPRPWTKGAQEPSEGFLGLGMREVAQGEVMRLWGQGEWEVFIHEFALKDTSSLCPRILPSPSPCEEDAALMLTQEGYFSLLSSYAHMTYLRSTICRDRA